MKGLNKEEIDKLVAEKRAIGSQNIRVKLSKMIDPVNRQVHIKKQVQYYKDTLHSLEIQMRHNQENATVAAQLYTKNKFREELKLYRLQLSKETIQGYIEIMEEKPKKVKKEKKFVPPDPVAPILAEPEPIPEPIIEEPIPLTPEEKKAIRMQVLEAKIADLEPIEEEEEFPCEVCGRIYATEPSRKRHITMRHKEI